MFNALMASGYWWIATVPALGLVLIGMRVNWREVRQVSESSDTDTRP